MQEAARAVQGAPVRLEDELADAAHELKAPIAVVLALCAGAAEATSLGELQADVARIEARVRALRGDLDALLDTARTGHVRAPQAAPADLVALVREEAEAAAVVAGRRGVDVRVDAPGRAGSSTAWSTPTACAPPCATSSATRSATPGRAASSGWPSGARGRGRGSRSPTTARACPRATARTSSTASAASSATPAPTRGRASAWPSCATWRASTAATSGVGRAPEGGALFALRLPLVSDLPPGPARRFRQRRPAPAAGLSGCPRASAR